MIWEAVVVGAGVGGLVAAGLLARSGRRVLLLEAHETPGGCAGFYEAGGFTFDAGATTLIGFDPGDPLATVAEALGLRLGEDLCLEPVDGVDVRLPGVSFLYGRDRMAWEESAARLFPGTSPFFHRLRRDAALLWETSRRWPVLPLLSPRDALRDLRLLSPRLLPLLPSFGKTVSDVLERERAPADPAFRTFLDLALLISVQSPASVAPWWNGALGIDLFRRGVSRARGGMRAFVEALAAAVVRAGGGDPHPDPRDAPLPVLRRVDREDGVGRGVHHSSGPPEPSCFRRRAAPRTRDRAAENGGERECAAR